MPKQTLLAMTQDILSSLDGAEVNSINDNVESQQVARIIRSCYNTIVSRGHLPELYDLFELTASGSASKPTLMTMPTTVTGLVWLKYNVATTENTDVQFEKMTVLSVSDFLDRMHQLSTSADNVGTFSHGDATYFYEDDRAPQFYTSPDDYTVIFDAYDNTVDTTLQASKTLCYGELAPAFSLTDTFIPDMDSEQFDILFNEAKALAFAEMKQAQHVKAEVNARKGWIHSQKVKAGVLGSVSDYSKLPNYGRRR